MKHIWWNISIILITILLLSSLATSIVKPIAENHEINTDIQYPISKDYFNDWHVQHENTNNNMQSVVDFNRVDMENSISEDALNIETTGDSARGPMDSAWPMQGHDVVHTCRSPYSTENNSGTEIWRVHGDEHGAVESSAVIDSNGIAYFGTLGADSSLYAMYPNGTRKWRYNANNLIWSTPAIADDGTIYLPSWGSNLIALYPNGQVKWEVNVQDPIGSSVTIGENGTIYIGTMAGNLYAINPNGSERWHLYLGGNLISSPTIGLDNTIYIGTTSNYLYAVNQNGTIRWRFGAGQFKGNPSIAEDGTILAPSFDGYLYALYPCGTMKWRASTGSSVSGAGVAFASDGTIYVGTELLRAYYPNGTLKWTTNVQGSIYGTVPALSVDGTIYVSAGGSLVAVNPDGTERWRKQLTIAQIHSSPSIGRDDRVYVGSEDYGLSPYGYLHAFGLGPLRAEAYGPYTGAMTQPLQFTGEAFGGTPPYASYHWDFGDGNTSEDQNPMHTYAHRGNYTAVLTVTDSTGNQSTDTAQVKIGYPLPKITIIKPVNALYIFNLKICNLPTPGSIVIGRIIIIAEVTQVDADIDRVEFYYDGDLKYTDRSPPYQYVWKRHPPPFDQDLWIRAYDTVGNRNDKMIYIVKLF